MLGAEFVEGGGEGVEVLVCGEVEREESLVAGGEVGWIWGHAVHVRKVHDGRGVARG